MTGAELERRCCAFTGHRPGRYPFGEDITHPDAVRLRERLHREIIALYRQGVDCFYSGMAQGADQWAAEQVLSLRDECGLPLRLICALPCRGQDRGWPKRAREHYLGLLLRADEVIYLAERYTEGCMQQRNRYMVDRAETLLAVYDGGEDGGTAHTVRYAMRRRRRIISIHPDSLLVTRGDPQCRLELP
ncbi:MAG: DUF1273 domain-containing protein [Clostridiales bacterium]|nr:DUF1273 domain-containing protein [Clostridiales bacterium]